MRWNLVVVTTSFIDIIHVSLIGAVLQDYGAYYKSVVFHAGYMPTFLHLERNMRKK